MCLMWSHVLRMCHPLEIFTFNFLNLYMVFFPYLGSWVNCELPIPLVDRFSAFVCSFSCLLDSNLFIFASKVILTFMVPLLKNLCHSQWLGHCLWIFSTTVSIRKIGDWNYLACCFLQLELSSVTRKHSDKPLIVLHICLNIAWVILNI